jgi:hypothetical protein
LILQHIAVAGLAVAAYVLVLALSGLGMMALLSREELSRIGKPMLATCAFALGQALVGNLLQLLAALGPFFRPGPIMVLLGTSAATGLLSLRQPELLRADIVKVKINDRLPLDWKVVLLGVAGLAALLTFACLHPPDGDAMAFYMAQPKVIASSGTLTLLPGYEAFAQIGLGSEMHFAAFYALLPDGIGEFAAKLFIAPVTLSLVWLVVGLGAQVGLGRIAQVILAAMVLSSSAVTNLVWDGKTDLIPALSALAAVYWSTRLRETGAIGRTAMLIGLLTSVSVTGKLSYAVAVVPMISVILIVSLVQRAKSKNLRFMPVAISTVGFGLMGCALGVLPLIIKNAMLFGEPLAPFVMLHSASSAILEQSWYTPENTRWIVVTYPLALVFGNYPMQHGTLSFLWLALLPLALCFVLPTWRTARCSRLTVLTIAALCGLVAWLTIKASVFAPRYILPCLLMLYPIVAAGAEKATQSGRLTLLRAAVPAAVLSCLAIAGFALGNALAETRLYIAGPASAWGHEFWRAARIINEESKPGARTFVAGYYTLPLRGDLLQCMIRPPESALVLNAKTSEQMWENLYMLGADWMFLQIPSHGRSFVSKIDITAAPTWLRVDEIKITAITLVYRLTLVAPAPVVRKSCKPDSHGTFMVTSSAAG